MSTKAPVTESRRYQLNMPQMALGGLSEAWLFREMGDIHWSMISKGLEAPSSAMADANGDRLYATFTRLRIKCNEPLLAFRENDDLSVDGHIERFGAGVYFGTVDLESHGKRISAHLMSSFTKRSSSDSNMSLLKGQPVVPESCGIPAFTDMPEFAQEYRARRAQGELPVLFEHQYQIQPYHDINGVGLLYFAVYPTINDLSELKSVEDPVSWCLDASTISRDVHYYGNCDLSDAIVYRLHRRENSDGAIRLISTLSRASDNVPIAYLDTVKATGFQSST